MAFPPAFNFDSEEHFIDDLVVPLLGRLGYSVVLHYHGTSEFGKDLIVGEFDRFSHVRYHGIQVKYKASISLSDSGEIIQDCDQAFTNEFDHPHTGQKHRISTFYLINGGSISDQAKTNFFSSVLPKYGDNAKMLDGKALIQLDLSATVIGAEPIRAMISGIIREMKYNAHCAGNVCASLKAMLEGESGYPVQRTRTLAVGSYLEQPPGMLITHYENLQQYWQAATMFNRIVDSVGGPVSVAAYTEARVKSATAVRDTLQNSTAQLIPLLSAKLLELGPLLDP